VPANGSFSGFSPGRVTKVRSGLNGVLGPLAPTDAAVSGVRSNAAGSSVCMMRVRCATNDTSLSFVDIIYVLYL